MVMHIRVFCNGLNMSVEHLSHELDPPLIRGIGGVEDGDTGGVGAQELSHICHRHLKTGFSDCFASLVVWIEPLGIGGSSVQLHAVVCQLVHTHRHCVEEGEVIPQSPRDMCLPTTCFIHHVRTTITTVTSMNLLQRSKPCLAVHRSIYISYLVPPGIYSMGCCSLHCVRQPRGTLPYK